MNGFAISRRSALAGAAALPLLGMRAPAEVIGGVTRLSPALDAVIAPDAAIERLASGYRWAEGPVWVERLGALLFSDVPANVVHLWTAEQGAVPFLSPSGLQGAVPAGIREAGANGLALDADGNLLLADSGSRAIVRVDLATRRRTVLADRFGSKRFNSPNDLAVAASGAVYFTDPPYGLDGGEESPLRELDVNGVYRLDRDGRVTLIDGGHRRPNGVALSPDGRRLYVALSDERRAEVIVYDLDENGMASDARTFRSMTAELSADAPGLPDGVKVDAAGRVFATGPGGVHILSPDGAPLGVISTGKAIANCAFGPGGRSLFMTSSDMLARVALIGA